jgi:hypothetical protein
MIDLDDLKGQLQARGVELQGQIAKQESELQAQLKGKRDEVQLYQNLQPHVRELETQKLDLELAILGLKFEKKNLEEKCAKLRGKNSTGLDVLDLIRQYCRDEYGVSCPKYRKLLELLAAERRQEQLLALRKSYETL